MHAQVRVGQVALSQADARDGQLTRGAAERHRPREPLFGSEPREPVNLTAFDFYGCVARDARKLHERILAENAVLLPLDPGAELA